MNQIEARKRERIFNDNFASILQSLPFTNESTLEAKINELLFNFKNDIRVYFTSGTTQKPKALYFDSRDVANIADYIKWFCEIEGMIGKERVAVFMDHSFWGTGHLTSLGHIAAGNSVIPIDLRSRDAIKEVLYTIPPTVISTLPSKLEEYADIIPKRYLKMLETTGESMSGKKREELERAYGAEIFDAYGLTEAVIGVECKNHEGYHYREDKVYIEIKSLDSNRIIDDGKIGEIVVTNLMCHTQPIIRYCTGDAGKITRESCPCGLKGPRLFLRGRVGKTHSLLDGAKLKDKIIKEVLQETIGYVPKYHVRVNVKKGNAYLLLESKGIRATDKKMIIKRLIESNFDILNLVKTKQLKIEIKTSD